jgi:hypothetical protein
MYRLGIMVHTLILIFHPTSMPLGSRGNVHQPLNLGESSCRTALVTKCNYHSKFCGLVA